MKKIVLFKGGVETQGFFSEQIEKALISMGYETFMYDYDREAVSARKLLHFIERKNTCMITFNFHGICNEELLRDDNGVYIWEELQVPCFNIVVDHPFYYDRFMSQLPPDYYQISIDEDHIDYLKRFYPQIKQGPFLPLGGTCLSWEGDSPNLPLVDRETDVLFTGSWAEPEFFGKYMESDGPEYEEFYRGVLNDLINNPEKTFEEVFEKAFSLQADDASSVSDDDLRLLYARMTHFDMYVRYYFRGNLIKELTENGVKVKCIGGGWDCLDTECPENLEHLGFADSIDCLREIKNAKISINVMPWFKRGAHDRIFNSMLNGAVSFTDSSRFLDTILKDKGNCLIYDLKKINKAPLIIKEALKDIDNLQKIADNGYNLAKDHTWKKRTEYLMAFIEKEMEKRNG